MQERVKALRKRLGLTQAVFGERIGVKANTITGYESGTRAPSDAIISAICREFGVRREWLAHGDGEMLVPPRSVTLDRISRRYAESETFRLILDVYSQLDPSAQDVMEDYIMRLADAIAAGRTPESIVPSREALAANSAASPENDKNAASPEWKAAGE